ncbi:MAG TPA: metallophosphoesterase family protein [bacterium]|jgi:putative phosphoesterase|nr:metallophosphoesterase family protein [bacterium]
MRVFVLSDIHDQTQHLRKLLRAAAAARPEALVLCGDISRPATLAQCSLAGARLSYCLGNCDRAWAEGLRQEGLAMNASGFDDVGVLSLPQDQSLAFCHFPAQARDLALAGGHQAVFYGHSHRPAAERLSLPGREVLLANPGDVQARYGLVSGLLYDSADQSFRWINV